MNNYNCPRCGIIGALPSADPKRCMECTTTDAAFDLLTALRSAQKVLCEDCGDIDTETNACDHTDVCFLAMEAIEKAEGKA